MLNFIHAHIAEFALSGALLAMFGYVIYLNVSYANEKKAEEQRRDVSLVHSTCEYDSTAQDRIFADKAIGATIGLGMGLLDVMMQALIKDTDKELKAILTEANELGPRPIPPSSHTVH